MELYQIRHFAAVAETGSFTKAAIRASVSQPALSASIAKLEEELGVKLFHRSPKSVTLTLAGRRFHMTAQEVLGACNKVKAELRASIADRPLRIGVLRTLPSAQLARLIETLLIELPETRIELVDGTREQLHSQLAGRKLLACISLKSESEPGPGQRSVETMGWWSASTIALLFTKVFSYPISTESASSFELIVKPSAARRSFWRNGEYARR